jgi:hypothetical protein
MTFLKSKVLGSSDSPLVAPRRDLQQHRRSAIFAPAMLEADGKMFEVQVLNISRGGALVEIDRPFSPADEFSIRIDGNAPLQAILVRSTEGKHGIAFREDPNTVAAVVERLLAAQDNVADLRAHPRRLVLLGASFHFDGAEVVCKIQNISRGGVFVRSETPLVEPADFSLTIGRFGAMSVRTKRLSESGMGCAFLEEPAEVEARIGHLLPAAG